jgi:hypothetical protein
MITTASRRGGSIATGNLAAGGGECPAGLAVPPEQPPGRCLGAAFHESGSRLHDLAAGRHASAGARHLYRLGFLTGGSQLGMICQPDAGSQLLFPPATCLPSRDAVTLEG